jgi:hypothetical protein
MSSGAFRLTNDDDPSSLAPRRLEIARSGLLVGEAPAVIASVGPPLDFGESISIVLLVSRTHGRPIDDMLNRDRGRPGRVYVCQYIGDTEPIPTRLSRTDIRILFWGSLEPEPS